VPVRIGVGKLMVSKVKMPSCYRVLWRKSAGRTMRKRARVSLYTYTYVNIKCHLWSSKVISSHPIVASSLHAIPYGIRRRTIVVEMHNNAAFVLLIAKYPKTTFLHV
jgi:hypothetical protein